VLEAQFFFQAPLQCLKFFLEVKNRAFSQSSNAKSVWGFSDGKILRNEGEPRLCGIRCHLCGFAGIGGEHPAIGGESARKVDGFGWLAVFDNARNELQSSEKQEARSQGIEGKAEEGRAFWHLKILRELSGLSYGWAHLMVGKENMPNDVLSSILEEMAFLAELNDENPFKVRALRNAAEIFSELPESVEELIENGGIKKIAGVGKGTQAIAFEYVKSGLVTEHEELKKGFPDGILELRLIRGLGSKKISALFERLQIGSLAELEYACEENRLVDIKGFGEKTQASILKSIREVRSYKGKVILPVALQEAVEVQERLSRLKGVSRVEATGELRRHLETISSIDFLLEGDEETLGKVLEKEAFKADPGGFWVKETERGMKARAFLAGPKNFGSRWIETTGPDSFVTERFNGKLSVFSSEEEAFSAKKISFVPAECRDLGIAATDLVNDDDIRGVFHLHTTWSDGKNTLEEMVAEAEKLGLEYLGVSDHSKSAFYANGLSDDHVLEQQEEIARVQKLHPKVRIFHGIESDILADGALDYSKAILRQFDFVIASIHGQMRMSPDDMTDRICAALANPATTWLGHWTGRLLLGRPGFEFDVEKVLQCAAKHGKSIELNANPYRLDIDWRILPRALELGVKIGIHPDAHSTGGLKDTRFGVWMARKAGVRSSQVLNTMSRTEMEAWLAERKPK